MGNWPALRNTHDSEILRAMEAARHRAHRQMSTAVALPPAKCADRHCNCCRNATCAVPGHHWHYEVTSG